VDKDFNRKQSTLNAIEDEMFENAASSSISHFKNCLMDISPIKYQVSKPHDPGSLQISKTLFKPSKKRNILTSSPQLVEEAPIVSPNLNCIHNSSCDLQKIDISSITSSKKAESVELCPRRSFNGTVNSEEIVPGSITGLGSGNQEGYLFQKSQSEEKSSENQELCQNQVKDPEKDLVVDKDIIIDPLLTCPVSAEAAEYLLVEFK